MKADLFRISLVGYLAFLLAGCNQIAAPNAPETPTHPFAETVEMTETQPIPVLPTQEDETQTNPSLPIPAVPGLQMLIEKAKVDLAQRLSISISRINLIETKDVFWADTSLGCPQQGITYAQVQTPGYLIILESNGNEFEYHANIHNYVFYCENPTPPILETPGNVQP